MIKFFRPMLSLLAGFVVLFFVATMISIFVLRNDLASILIALPFAYFTGRATWRLLSGNEMSTWFYCLSGALLVGAVSFTIGFVGPMLAAAGGNQGPMVGLFITGPIGTIVGAIAGFSYARWRRNKV